MEVNAPTGRERSDEDTSIPEPDPESDAFWDEVKRLPSRQAQAIALHYVEDLSVTDITEVLEVAEGTVKALLHQGRSGFAGSYEPGG
jgi:RNA polymerase sigma-70 factor (ECF subfamily)